MKNLITTITLILLIGIVNAQGIYQQKMGEALGTFGQAQTVEDFQKAAANFELIATVETTEWLPLYYHAQCYILMSFNDNAATENEKDAYLAIADETLTKMIEIAPIESEIYALQALYYTAKLVINPMTRGQEYGMLTQVAIQKSLALDAKNPRAKQLNLSNKMGTAQFFGQDISKYCNEVNTLLQVWDAYESKGPFYPTWGKNQLLSLSKQCSSNGSSTPEDKEEAKQVETPQGTTLTVNITKLKSDKGYVMLGLYDENEKTVMQTMGTIKNGQCTIVLEGLEAGNYAVRFFHDANENKKMDATKRGIPTENYGFSNNARGFFGAPKYKKTLFELSADLSLNIKARG